MQHCARAHADPTPDRLAVLAGANLFAVESTRASFVSHARHERHAFPTLAAAMLTAIAGLGVVYLARICRRRTSSWLPEKVRRTSFCSASRQLPSQKPWRRSITWPASCLATPLSGWAASTTALGAGDRGSRWLVLHDFSALEHQLAALGGRF